MLNRLKVNRADRIPNQKPPGFVPNKNQGEKIQGPGPVIINPGMGENSGGPGPGMGGNPGGPGPGPGMGGNPGGPGPGPGMGGNPGGPGPGMNPGMGGNPGGPGGGQWQPHQKLRPCVGKFAYIWLNNGSEFWFYVQSVTPRYLFGWRMRNGRWQNGRIAINRIDSFYCNRRD